MFPFLAGRHPEAAPAIDRLRTEHEHIAALVEELREALSGTDLDSVRTEVDRLTTELEAHLTYEEEQLIPLLDRA